MLSHLVEENILGAVVGLRPFREGGPRIETERLREKLLVHNYGHGGSGITLCWGTSEVAVSLLRDNEPAPCSVAVLGAGAVGLCTALLLIEEGYRVELFFHQLSPDTTSDIAGGLWAPTHLNWDPNSELYKRVLTTSWRRFEALESDEYGVFKVPLYECSDSPHPLDPFPAWLAGEGRTVEKLPFGPASPPGVIWETYLIETSRFLGSMAQEVKRRGGRFTPRFFTDKEEIPSLPHDAVINCLGLGSGSLFGDPKVKPIRGQLLYLRPLKDRFILDHAGGYIISRSDKLVLGGSFEEGSWDLAPDPQTSFRILESNRAFPWGI